MKQYVPYVLSALGVVGSLMWATYTITTNIERTFGEVKVSVAESTGNLQRQIGELGSRVGNVEGQLLRINDVEKPLRFENGVLSPHADPDSKVILEGVKKEIERNQ
jgi:hypothetical protein